MRKRLCAESEQRSVREKYGEISQSDGGLGKSNYCCITRVGMMFKLTIMFLLPEQLLYQSSGDF